MTISGRPFIVGCYETPSLFRKDQTKLVFSGITRIRKREIKFKAECDASDTIGFINNMQKSFLSIYIQER